MSNVEEIIMASNVYLESIGSKSHKEISTLEEMTTWLGQLEEHASDSVGAALKAQLQVIRFVQSPSLVDTTLDTLILNLKKALKYADSPRLEDELRERFSLMIQNYVFFFDARLQLEINDNKEEARKLFETAGEMLTQCVKDLALMVATSGAGITKVAVMQVLVKNVFAQNNSETTSLFQKLVRWWNKSNDIAKKQTEFYQTIANVVLKLGKYSDLIGSSMLINGMIERYIPKIKEYLYKDRLEEIETVAMFKEQELEEQPVFFSNKSFTITVFVLGVVTILLRWMWYGLSSMTGSVVSWFIDDYVVVNHVGWFLPHLYWVLGITVVVELFYVIKSIIKRKELNKEIEEVNIQYNTVLVEIDDFEKSLYIIADKFNEI